MVCLTVIAGITGITGIAGITGITGIADRYVLSGLRGVHPGGNRTLYILCTVYNACSQSVGNLHGPQVTWNCALLVVVVRYFNVHIQGEREMFYLTTHSTHFIYGYMASDIWLRTILIVRKETRCRHIGYSYRLTARVLLYSPSHRQDNTYQDICYTSRGALAGMRNSSMGPPHEGSIRRPITP